jgi:hypothetical protein
MQKRAHWGTCRKTIDAPPVAQIFIDGIVRLQGVPQEVVSDNDVRFTADYWREVARLLQTKQVMSTAFHPEMDGLSENSNMAVVRYFHGFASHDQANWKDYLPLAEYTYNSSVNHSMKRTPFKLDLGYEAPLPLKLIADLQRRQTVESTKTLQGCKFVEGLQRNLGVDRAELRDAQVNQTAETNMSQCPIDPAITASAKVFLDTNDLPITNANVNPTRHKLVHHYIGPYNILRIRENTIEPNIANYIMIYNTVTVSRLKGDQTNHSRIAWRPPPRHVRTSYPGTSYVVQSIANHSASSEGRC